MTEFEKPTPVNIVFDLDGTLTDPALGFVRCINYALTEHGLDEVEETQLKQYIGPPLDVSFREILNLNKEDDVNSFIIKYRERYSDVGYKENSIYKGIPEALVALKSLGLTMGVCTSKRTDFAEKILNLFDIQDNFQFVNGADVGITKREQLSELIRQGQVNNRSIMVGDRAIDIYSARKNNMKTAGVLYGYGSWHEIDDVYPNHYIEMPEYLPLVLGDAIRRM